MMCDERLRSSATIDRLKNGRINFNKIAAVKEITNRLDYLCAGEENLFYIRINNQIHISLSVPGFFILQTMPLLGQGTQTFSK